MAADPSPVARSTDGRTYVCALDGAAIPDGTPVQGLYTGVAGSKTLVGVRAVRSADGTVAHSCGTITGLTGIFGGGQRG